MTQTTVADAASWTKMTSRMLLLLGVAQLIAGVVFFFAFNWDDMSKWQKFATIEAGLLICALAARWRGFDDLVGQLLLVGAAVLAGVALAVSGQIYQTGADMWELFAGWSAIIAIWVFGSRFSGLWVLWFLLIDVAVALFFADFRRMWGLNGEDIFFILGALNGVFLIVRETLRSRAAWAAPIWLRWLLFASFILLIGFGAVVAILDYGRGMDIEEATAIGVFIVGVGISFAWYRSVARDLVVAVLLVLSIATVVCVTVMRLLDATFIGDSDLVVTAVMVMVVLAAFGSAGVWVTREHRRLQRSEGDGA